MINTIRILTLFMLAGLSKMYGQGSIKVCLQEVQCAIEHPARAHIPKLALDSTVQPADTNIYVQATYRIKYIEEIDKVKIKVGLNQNSNECLEADAAISESGGKYYVHFDGQQYEIFYHHGFYRSVISETQALKANWLSIYAIDKNGNQTQTYYYRIK